MKTLLFTGVTVSAVIALAWYARRQTRVAEEATLDYETDQMLIDVLSECMEAFCQDCGMVLAQGTHPYHDDVAAVAYNHGEMYDHDVRVRSWAE